MNNEQGIFEENQQIAYLIAQKKHPLRYKPIRHDGKVKFILIGSGLEQAIQNFFANDLIPVQDYLSAFTTIRKIVAAMKER